MLNLSMEEEINDHGFPETGRPTIEEERNDHGFPEIGTVPLQQIGRSGILISSSSFHF
jgi:hypothetical protein